MQLATDKQLKHRAFHDVFTLIMTYNGYIYLWKVKQLRKCALGRKNQQFVDKNLKQ